MTASTSYRESGVMWSHSQNPDLYVRLTIINAKADGSYGRDSFVGMTRVANNRPNVTFDTRMVYDWSRYGRGSGPEIRCETTVIFCLWDRNAVMPDESLMRFGFYVKDLSQRNNSVIEHTEYEWTGLFVRTKNTHRLRFKPTVWCLE